MKLCIPTRTDEGLEATSTGHFGSAPYFTLVDTESEELTTLANPDVVDEIRIMVQGESHGEEAIG